MKKEKILNTIKLGMLAIMLILLFFISDRFVDYLVTVDIETLKKEVTNFPQYDNIVVAPGTKIYVVETGETQVVGE